MQKTNLYVGYSCAIAALREKDLTYGKRQLLKVKIAVAQVRLWP